MSILDKDIGFKLPKHIAVIMDGNGRWAQGRHLPRMLGHKEGLKSVKRLIQLCAELKEIEVLTLFAFGRENWRRPAQEVNHLMTLFLNTLKSEVGELNKNNIQLRVIGCKERFTAALRESIESAQQLTKNNTGLKLVIAVDYSGQWDIVQATQKLAQQIEQGLLKATQITEALFAQQLATADLPMPDLLIRTSGEYRISNFMLWQFAYTEFYFSAVFWPDFNKEEFKKALFFYSQRERRFGRATIEDPIEAHA